MVRGWSDAWVGLYFSDFLLGIGHWPKTRRRQVESALDQMFSTKECLDNQGKSRQKVRSSFMFRRIELQLDVASFYHENYSTRKMS